MSAGEGHPADRHAAAVADRRGPRQPDGTAVMFDEQVSTVESMVAGTTALTVIPRGPRCWASGRVSVERALGHGVADDVGNGDTGGAGGDVDDAPAVGEAGSVRLDDQERRGVVDLLMAGEVLGAELLDGAAQGDPGVVHQHPHRGVAQWARGRVVGGPEGGSGVGRGQVGGEAERPATGRGDLLDDAGGIGVLAVVDGDGAPTDVYSDRYRSRFS